jgi:hypothetical protein
MPPALQEVEEQRREIESRVERLLDELNMPEEFDAPAETDVEAVQRALNFILTLALDEDNFTTFGSDIFQTFYDVATTAEEPLRKFALLRSEVAAQMWLHVYPSFGGDTSASEGGEPEADEVLDFVMGIYTLERVGIGHDSKESVREAAKKLKTDELFDVGESCFSMKVRHMRPTMEWRQYTKALTHTFYASKIGVDIGQDLVTVLRLLPLYRPYRAFTKLSKDNDSFDEYTDQITMLFNLIHVLSNYGELRLAPSLLPQEYAFLSDPVHLERAISFSDVHLVGEIVHCLRVLGMAETDPTIVEGVKYLRAKQKLDGSWPTRDDAEDEYVRYHAAMCAISALSPQRFRGYGPGEPDKVYSVLIATRHDTLMSVASHGIRAVPTLQPGESVKGEALSYAANVVNETTVDKSKDTFGHPCFLNDRVPPLAQFSGLRSLYTAQADYVKTEVNIPAALYGADRLKMLLAETRSANRKKSQYLEPAGIRHAKKKKRKNPDDDDYKISS